MSAAWPVPPATTQRDAGYPSLTPDEETIMNNTTPTTLDTSEVIAALAADPETTVSDLAAAADRYGFDPLEVLALVDASRPQA